MGAYEAGGKVTGEPDRLESQEGSLIGGCAAAISLTAK